MKFFYIFVIIFSLSFFRFVGKEWGIMLICISCILIAYFAGEPKSFLKPFIWREDIPLWLADQRGTEASYVRSTESRCDDNSLDVQAGSSIFMKRVPNHKAELGVHEMISLFEWIWVNMISWSLIFTIIRIKTLIIMIFFIFVTLKHTKLYVSKTKFDRWDLFSFISSSWKKRLELNFGIRVIGKCST